MILPATTPLRHAYCIEGDEHTLTQLKDELSATTHVPLHENPDVYEVRSDTLLVGEARDIIAFATQTPLIKGGQKYIFIVCTRAMTEAQNALLKTLEEPPLRTHIFIITPRVDALLPTVRSRCELLHSTKTHVQTPIPTHTQELLTYITDIAKTKDIARMHELLEHFERRAQKEHNAQAIETVIKVKAYFYDKGAMRKMLLESVALML